MKIIGKCFILALTVTIAWGQCLVNIKKDLSTREPVFFREGQLWAPDGPSLRWNQHEITSISCQTTTLNGFDVRNANIRCQSETRFTIGEVERNSNELICSRKVTGDIEITTIPCWDGTGQLRNIGFRTANGEFVTYIQSCYNMTKASVIYTNHFIPGRAINFSISESDIPAFKVTGASGNVDLTSYTQVEQLKRLKTLLGSKHQARQFIRIDSFLARGHLSPNADGIFRPWQWATYYYVNAAPQWQVINNGNWKRVEFAVRHMAMRLHEDVLIFTGVHGILTLPHVNGSNIPITLHTGGIEVPRWFWKIIKSPSRNSGIALITNNDPLQTDEDSAKFCTDICGPTKWENKYYHDFARGYTFCCEVPELMNILRYIPADAAVTSTLTFES